MTPAQYCRHKTHKARSSFFLPFFFLSPPRRSALYALYAFCREVDDIVDGPLPREEARFRLDAWRQELRHTFEGSPQHPVSREIARYQPCFALPTAPFYDILDGMEMDLEHNRYPTLEALELYCHRVAVAVGLISLHIFAHDPPTATQAAASTERPPHPPTPPAPPHPLAQHLGMALQLTNILRDVSEDAKMGRIYLPQDLLKRTGANEADVLHNRWTPQLAEAMRQLGEEAQQHFQKAEESLPVSAERHRMLPAFLMSGIYQAYLTRLRQNQFGLLHPLPSFSTSTKLWILGRTWWRERKTP